MKNPEVNRVPLEEAPPAVIAYGWILMAKYSLRKEQQEEFISEMFVMKNKFEED